ncbi:cytochrome P450 [Aspergillus steynii IBT 23096]|uniref:Cytochrome P450 n=1 Tax=Aspergillus steynii IBT 23096 TaxID=1392250 RepID=A0A2I2G1E3_9EURO|nr:cytochrome P450 [Aspergillus steynii IBT 23096]PLB46689.1 cytochrome P450 [Aspergillus steynii IBT 23096]
MIVILTILGSIFLLYLIQWKRTPRTLPPGPDPLPLIGNLHQFARLVPLKTFHDWHKKYGSIVGLTLGPRTLVILGTHAINKELLGGKGQIYSSRPYMPLVTDHMTGGLNTALIPYGERWKTHNRIHLALLNPRMARLYEGLVDFESRRLLTGICSTKDFSTVIYRYTASLILSLQYGKSVDVNDPMSRDFKEITHKFVKAIGAGNFLFECLPALQRIPPSIAPWIKESQGLHHSATTLFSSSAEKGVNAKEWNWSKYVRTLKDAHGMPEEELWYLMGILYEAATDTSVAILRFFIMACVLHPSAVEKAQKELDSVVGDSRLPKEEDMAQLPHVSVFINEVIRWRPATPEGIPRATSADDVYQGYHIPKDTTVIVNMWAMHMDPNVYDDPESFRPDRWIEKPDLPLGIFGYGRRACAGRHFAQTSLNSVVSRMLWAFSFSHSYENGRRVEIDPWDLEQHGASLRPGPFSADIRPRDASRRAVLEKGPNVDRGVEELLTQVDKEIS